MIHEILNTIQTTLKAPKGQYNNFGKYKYRSCEDILEAIKPVLNGCSLVISDEVVAVGDRIYVKATATLSLKDESVSASAYAREPLDRKGMDDSQITGSSSSYSRKYALNGLFCIDDTKDADTMEKPAKTAKTESTTNVLTNARDLNDLVRIWNGLSPADKAKYQEIKEEMKKKLEKVA